MYHFWKMSQNDQKEKVNKTNSSLSLNNIKTIEVGKVSYRII